MSSDAQNPHLVLTVVLDSGARPAAVTRSHGDAIERAYAAMQSEAVAGLDLVELPVGPKLFQALRQWMQAGTDIIGLYDLFPLAAHLDAPMRKVAGQFLAAEALWALDAQGQLGGVPVSVKLDLPKDWQRDPSAVHAHLLEAKALDLSAAGVEAFRRIKQRWDQTHTATAADESATQVQTTAS